MDKKIYKITGWRNDGGKLDPYLVEFETDYEDIEQIYYLGQEKLLKKSIPEGSGLIVNIILWSKNDVGIYNNIYPTE